MSMNQLPRILLLPASPPQEQKWRDSLGVGCCEIVNRLDAAGCNSFDIVLADHRRVSDLDSLKAGFAEPYGLIAVGEETAADVVFPYDPSSSELRLACDLLYKIVRLRRESISNQQAQRRLMELAEQDALTGLANRRAWDEELMRRMSRDFDEDENLCLAILDLDRFKEINTQHGYATADKVLRQVAESLKSNVRDHDYVARIGGDEFGVLLSNLAPEFGHTVVDRLRLEISAAGQRIGNFSVTATAGLAMRKPGDSCETLFELADANLRRGKIAGRDQTFASE
ncbi:MAG: GGDEF domain-containing protein [Planctomycetaceae bacterium]|nr:GGDEF domain-containing protein [Planctomycetales bacterium]MCB9926837.1 GGDEF domain-containing protein [Planctomycetaceae bacterium]